MRWIISLAILLGSSCLASGQVERQRISLFMDFDVELPNSNNFIGPQYQYSFSKRSNFAAHLGFAERSSFSLGADYIFDMPLILNKLEFNIGAGLSLLSSKDVKDTRNTIKAIGGNVGFTYSFDTPISIFVLWRPKAELFTFDEGETTSLRFGLGYRF